MNTAQMWLTHTHNTYKPLVLSTFEEFNSAALSDIVCM